MYITRKKRKKESFYKIRLRFYLVMTLRTCKEVTFPSQKYNPKNTKFFFIWDTPSKPRTGSKSQLEFQVENINKSFFLTKLFGCPIHQIFIYKYLHPTNISNPSPPSLYAIFFYLYLFYFPFTRLCSISVSPAETLFRFRWRLLLMIPRGRRRKGNFPLGEAK